MTDSFRCSDIKGILATFIFAVLPLSLKGQNNVWNLPGYRETVRVGSVGLGTVNSRDTYLSQSTYSGFLVAGETDTWTGYKPYRLFSYGRTHSALQIGLLNNSLGGGETMSASGSFHWSGMWHAVETGSYDLLLGPAAMTELAVLYNVQNSNNPVDVTGYIGAGICVDNTVRFSVFHRPMAVQATFHMPLAGVGFAPDYDMPYWYIYQYGEYGKVLHFINPFNNPAFTQQVDLIVPVRSNRLRIGYTFDYQGNRLGGHKRHLGMGYFTLGYVMRFETKDWGRVR